MTFWRRRLVALAAALALVVGAVVLATGGSDPEPVRELPEAGSGFRPTIPASRGSVEPRTTAERAQQAKADAGLPVPLVRAAAQLFLVGFPGRTAEAPIVDRLRSRDWGAVLVDRANVAGTAQLRGLTRGIDAVARRADRQPPLVVAAHLGGRQVAVPGIGPERQADVADPAAARREAREAGRALRRLGVDLVLSPSADLGTAGGPWEGRAFSDDPQEAARMVEGAVAGWRDARVAPVVGHFPGEGAASQDPELGVATVGLSRDELRRRDQVPFAAVAGRAPAVQLSGALYAGFDGVTPATFDPVVVRTLRKQLFAGVVVSANLTAATLATGESVGAGAVAALKAGCDLLFVPGDRDAQEEAYAAVVTAVRAGEVPAARVREALERIAALRAPMR